MSDLLIELGCEELPAGSMMPMAEHLANSLFAVLQQSQLCNQKPEVFATPRRIAVRFSNVGDRQADTVVERKGPAKAAAFKDGAPTKALEGFMRSASVTLDELNTIDTPKGEWIVVKQTKTGKALVDVLSEALPNAIKTMAMPRRMRWGSTSHEFLRPVVWLLALHGSTTLPLSVLGLNASNKSLGHRFHSPEPLLIDQPSNYEAILEAAFVMVDPAERRARIVKGVQREAIRLNGTPVMDEELVDEVNALVEWPVALAGRFDEEFLEIPKEALIQTMQENQRYFALLDNNGELMPAFITVANIESQNEALVIDGNERVIRPRFADTMFFWNQDKQGTLASHQAQLSRLLFQEKLGSVADKVSRMGVLAEWLASTLNVNKSEVALAVSLCKCDLNTEIVKELAKMQGICGRYYALRDGHPPAVAEAMEQHYFPKQAGGKLPQSSVSQMVALADKTDTLVGIFGLGMKPTGAKDPFALRRASLGIVRIIVEHKLDLDLVALLDASLATYEDRLDAPDKGDMLAYIVERMRGYLVDQGFAPDAIDAVLAKEIYRPLDIVSRLQALQQFRKTDAAVSLAAASKRIGNILKKVATPIPLVAEASLLREDAESKLFMRVVDVTKLIEKNVSDHDYASAMSLTASLRDDVDAFFEQVMVMDENESLRDNRLALLRQVNTLCCGTAELSLLKPLDSAGGAKGGVDQAGRSS
ncbi:MAG: glycyl-tRNA synthetase beta chain [Granulosicoccus sp.]|jgi:glycyl-tRNA synthetase beta chain